MRPSVYRPEAPGRDRHPGRPTGNSEDVQVQPRVEGPAREAWTKQLCLLLTLLIDMSRYRCRICGERADEKAFLVDHIDSEHDTVPWFVDAAINEGD